MTTRTHILSLFLCILCIGKTACQEQVYKYPFRFSLYSNCQTFINPAHATCYSDHELASGSKRLFGAISNVSASYFLFNMRIQQKQINKPYSSAGVLLYNDNEGKYLNRTRFYASYSWHANLSQKVRFSAGLVVGGMNYSVKGTALSGNGSDTKMDGSVGVNFYSNSFNVGISVGQIFNSKIQPLEEVTVLSPMLNISGAKIFMPDADYSIMTSFVTSLLFPAENDKSIHGLNDVTIQVKMKKKFLVSTGIHNNTMMMFAIGFDGLEIGSGNLGMIISYTFPAFRRSALKTNYGEVGVSYRF